MTPKRIQKGLKRDLWRKVSRKEKAQITTRHFSSVSCKDSFRIIMTLVAHYDLELHQMDVKTAFLNGDLEKNVYMAQPKGFIVEGKERMGCRLKKSIYRLKQASRQWYLKFDSTIRKFGFQENIEDNCVYAKFKNRKYIFQSCMWMTSYSLAVMLIFYQTQRSSCP